MNVHPLSKSLLVLLLLLTGLHTPGYCDDPFKMGLVTPEDLKMTTYAPDTSAAAVVLYDMGESSFLFTKGTQLQFKRIMRIKILKKSGLNQADIVIPYYRKGDGSREEIQTLKGVTYNWENGQVVKLKLDENAVFDEKRDANWHLKKLTLPGVKVGSVIELTYTIKSDFMQFLRDWEFQHDIPVKWSEYRVGMVPFYEYKQVQHGFHPFHIKESEVKRKTAAVAWEREAGLTTTEERGTISMQVVNYRWVMTDVPAFTEEPYLSNSKDYLSKLEFELSKVEYEENKPTYLSGNWESFTKELLKEEEFGGQLANTTFLKKTAAELIAGKTDTLEKVKAVLNYVNSTMRWDGKHRIYTEHLRKAFDKRTGSSSEVNLLLTALLREAGVNAHPMLVSTRQHGKPLEQSPMISKFDYVIAHASVAGKPLLLDATEPDLPFGMLPMRCLNGKGWVAQAPAGKWVSLAGTDKNIQFVNGVLQLLPTGEVKGTLTESFQGVPALHARSAIRSKGQETYLKDLANVGPDWTRQHAKIQNLDNLQEPLKTEYQLHSTGEDQPVALLYLSPMLLHGKGENPFKVATRLYPVDFAAPIDETFVFTYQLPQGYDVEELPTNASMALPGNAAKFYYQAQVQNGQLQVTSKLIISKTVFAPEEYANLREFYSRMVAKHAEKIVLRKKS